MSPLLLPILAVAIFGAGFLVFLALTQKKVYFLGVVLIVICIGFLLFVVAIGIENEREALDRVTVHPATEGSEEITHS